MSKVCKSLQFFHALTGCDTTSSFKYKGKRSCWKLLQEDHTFVEGFASIMQHPLVALSVVTDTAKAFICRLYQGDAKGTDLDLVRMNTFCHKTRDIERIPPTSNAFEQHLKRCIF